jgi:hypothetical protein
MEKCPLHLPLHTLSSCYSTPTSILPYTPPPLQSSSHSVHANFGTDKHVMDFARNKRFGLVDTGLMGLEGNSVVGQKWKASSVVVSTIHGAYFCGLIINTETWN